MQRGNGVTENNVPREVNGLKTVLTVILQPALTTLEI